MIVITLTNCPLSLKGDLSKWFQEVSSGTYVGNVSARVRDRIWCRITENIKSGSATMVFSANNEQGMDFRVHNSNWEPISFDGLKLILRPSQAWMEKKTEIGTGFSKIAKIRKAKLCNKGVNCKYPSEYVILDIETTGLSVVEDEILEIGAILVVGHNIKSTFHAMIKTKRKVPKFIKQLTGITDAMLNENGRELREVMPEFIDFVKEYTVISHNAAFDYQFIRKACKLLELPLFSNKSIDTLSLAKRTLKDVEDYKLETLLKHFNINFKVIHRSIEDCILLKQVYEKLINFQEKIK